MVVYLSEYIDPKAEQFLREHATVVSTFDRIEEIDAIILRNIPVTAEMMDRAKASTPSMWRRPVSAGSALSTRPPRTPTPLQR